MRVGVCGSGRAVRGPACVRHAGMAGKHRVKVNLQMESIRSSGRYSCSHWHG